MPSVDASARRELARLVTELAVVRGQVTLSSGKEADYYVDLRRATLHHAAAPLIGRLRAAAWPGADRRSSRPPCRRRA